VLPWAITKTIWTFGGNAFGITGDRWKASNSGESGAAKALAEVGIDTTVLAAGMAFFLVAGLMYPWGQVFPRWTLVLAGRRVPRLLPLIPAWTTGFGLALYGVALLGYAPLAALGVVPAPAPDPDLGGTRSGTLWLATFGAAAFGGLGFALLTAARSYTTRTRPTCAAPQPTVTPD
jgi:D-alanyl-D-alanine dipeptidase